MGGHTVSRRFQADRVGIIVHCPDPDVRRAVDAAFCDLDPCDGKVETVEIELRDEGSWLSVWVGGQVRFTAQPREAALASLVSTVTRLSLDADPERLHLHCAAVAHRNHGVLISAPSGTGKTTLAATLVAAGWIYGTDESVAFDHPATTVTTFPKPLLVKPGTAALVPALDRGQVLEIDDDAVWSIPASTFGAALTHSIEPRSIVILTTAASDPLGEPSKPRAMHPADAVVALMEQVMDAERFGPTALDVLASAAARCRCVKLRVGPLDDAERRLTALTREEDTPTFAVVVMGAAAEGASRWKVPEHVRSVVIGERAVVHDTLGGMIVALDEAGTGLWQALHGRPPDGWPMSLLGEATTQEFLGSLATMGLVRSTQSEGASP